MINKVSLDQKTQSYSVPGVAVSSEPFQKLKRRLVLAVVVIPFLGVLLAFWQLWHSGAGLVDAGLLFVMYFLTILGISVGFHRHFAHRSFQTTRPVRIILAILGSMAIQGPILTWVATHRRHHQYSDKLGDPHSPYVYAQGEDISSLIKGLWHSHIGWLFAPEVTNWGHYVPDLLRDKLIFKLDRLYFIWMSAGFLLPMVVGGLLTWSWRGGLSGFLWGGVVRVFLVHHFSWTIGSICHIYGSRPFRTHDRSTNNAWLSIMTVGDSWHNNHHAFPSSALHGLKPSQIDLAGLTIRALKAAGLAWKVEVPSAEAVAAKRPSPPPGKLE